MATKFSKQSVRDYLSSNSNYEALSDEEKGLLDFLNNEMPVGSSPVRSSIKNKSMSLDHLKLIAELVEVIIDEGLKAQKRNMNARKVLLAELQTDNETKRSTSKMFTKMNADPKFAKKKVGRLIVVNYNDKILSALREIRNSYNNRESETLPLLFRQAIYAVVFARLHDLFGTTKDDRIDFVKLDFQGELLRQVGLTKKMFQSWGMTPVEDFLIETTDPVVVNFERNGRKRDDLLFPLSRLVGYPKPKRFIDIFGGTGAVTAAMNRKQEEVYNDFDIFLYNFFDCLQRDEKKIIEIARNYHTRILNYSDPVFLALAQQRKVEVLKKLSVHKADYRNIQDYSDFYIKYQAFVYEQLERGTDSNFSGCDLQKYRDELEKIKEGTVSDSDYNRRFEIAASWLFLHLFPNPSASNGVSISNFSLKNYVKSWLEFLGYVQKTDFIYSNTYRDAQGNSQPVRGTGIEDSNLGYMDEAVELEAYAKRFKRVKLRQADFRDIFKEADSAGKSNATPEQTVVYLDPPYFLTAQYTDSFPDSFHLDMLDWLRTTKCKWVMSCKDTVTNKGQCKKAFKYRRWEDNEFLIKNFLSYFEILKYGRKLEEGFYVADKSSKNIMKDLFVYKNVDEKYSEIMITNFHAPTGSRYSFDLFWSKRFRSGLKGRRKEEKKYLAKAGNFDKMKMQEEFFERETYDDFLERISK